MPACIIDDIIETDKCLKHPEELLGKMLNKNYNLQKENFPK